MRPLIVLGFSARAAAFSAKAAGLQPYAIDLFADRDLAAICPVTKIARYPQDFLQALQAAPQAPWMYVGGLENFPALVDRLAETRPLLGNTGKSLRKVRNCRLLAETARELGMPFPETRLANGRCFGTQAKLKEESASESTWLFKPRRGSGGLGIRPVQAAENGPRASKGYWQAMVEGQSASAVFVSVSGQARLLGATRQIVGRDCGIEPPFLYVGSLAPLVLREEELAKLNQLGNELAGRFGLVGLWNVDFIRTASALWPLEVNPRYSASVEVLERASGRSFVREHVAACEAGVMNRQQAIASSPVVGKAIAYAKRRGVVLPGFEALIDEWNRPGLPPGIFDLPRIGETIQAGHPVATVMVEGGSEAEVERELRERVWRIVGVVSGEWWTMRAD